MNDTGWTFVPTAEELERIARLADDRPDYLDDSDDLAPARGIMIGLIASSLFIVAIGLLIAAVRSR